MNNRGMKDSGIEWMGDIPENWEVVKLKFLSKVKTGDKDTINKDDNGIYPFFVRSPKVEKINTYSFDGEAVLTAGDGDVGKIFHYINGKFDFHQRVYCFYDFKKCNGKFFYYFMGVNFINEVGKGTAKTTVESLRLPMIKNFNLNIPPLHEQQAIATYLDEKVSNLDRLINDQQMVIEEWKAYKQSLITETVTKGLNPEVNLKDSGIDWIGEIPIHWEVSKVKNLATEKNTVFLDGDWIESEFITNSGVRLIQTGNIGVGFYKEQGFRYITEETFEILNCRYIEAGDLLISRLAGPVGRSCLAPKLEEKMICSVDICSLRPNENIDPKFLNFHFTAKGHLEYCSLIARGATLQRISRKQLGNVAVVIPPLHEQQQISDFLDEKCSKIDQLIESKQKLIKELKAYKQSLIYECVTGKKEIV